MRCRKNGCVLSWDAYPGWPGGGLMLTYADYPLYFPCPKNIRNDGHTVRGQCHPVRTPFVHSPVPTNSWEFRKSSPCRPFDVLPNVNATNS